MSVLETSKRKMTEEEHIEQLYKDYLKLHISYGDLSDKEINAIYNRHFPPKQVHK